jgi:curved DNA-binding protein CbpA
LSADYYSILGVDSGALADDIRRAYHAKAKLYHPDIYRGIDGDLKFKLLNEAYRTLINPEKRRRYDFKLRYGTAPDYSVRDRDRRYNPYAYEEIRRRKREQSRRETENLRKRFRMFDGFVFWSLLTLGIAGLGFGIADLIVNSRPTGILFILVIIFVIIYTFRSIKKAGKR